MIATSIEELAKVLNDKWFIYRIKPSTSTSIPTIRYSFSFLTQPRKRIPVIMSINGKKMKRNMYVNTSNKSISRKHLISQLDTSEWNFSVKYDKKEMTRRKFCKHLPNELIDLIASFCPYRIQLRALCDAMKNRYPHIMKYALMDEIRSWDRSKFNHMANYEWMRITYRDRLKLSHRRMRYGSSDWTSMVFRSWKKEDGVYNYIHYQIATKDYELQTYSRYVDCNENIGPYHEYRRRRDTNKRSPFHWEETTGYINLNTLPLLRYSDV